MFSKEPTTEHNQLPFTDSMGVKTKCKATNSINDRIN